MLTGWLFAGLFSVLVAVPRTTFPVKELAILSPMVFPATMMLAETISDARRIPSTSKVGDERENESFFDSPS